MKNLKLKNLVTQRDCEKLQNTVGKYKYSRIWCFIIWGFIIIVVVVVVVMIKYSDQKRLESLFWFMVPER